MPSSRAVLADIHELKLDPMKAHTKLRTSGRLMKSLTPVTIVKHVHRPSVVEKPVEEVKAAPVTLRVTPQVEEPVVAPPLDVAQVEEPKVEETVVVALEPEIVAAVDEVVVKKPNNRFKKKEKPIDEKLVETGPNDSPF